MAVERNGTTKRKMNYFDKCICNKSPCRSNNFPLSGPDLCTISIELRIATVKAKYIERHQQTERERENGK